MKNLLWNLRGMKISALKINYPLSVSICHFFVLLAPWIINEESVNFKNGCHIRTSHVIISHCTKCPLPPWLGSGWLTICHYSWIINEECVKFKNGCHIRTSHIIIRHCTKFHLPTWPGSGWLTILIKTVTLETSHNGIHGKLYFERYI